MKMPTPLAANIGKFGALSRNARTSHKNLASFERGLLDNNKESLRGIKFQNTKIDRGITHAVKSDLINEKCLSATNVRRNHHSLTQFVLKNCRLKNYYLLSSY